MGSPFNIEFRLQWLWIREADRKFATASRRTLQLVRLTSSLFFHLLVWHCLFVLEDVYVQTQVIPILCIVSRLLKAITSIIWSKLRINDYLRQPRRSRMYMLILQSSTLLILCIHLAAFVFLKTPTVRTYVNYLNTRTNDYMRNAFIFVYFFPALSLERTMPSSSAFSGLRKCQDKRITLDHLKLYLKTQRSISFYSFELRNSFLDQTSAQYYKW